jgi:hypothetical protein
MWLNRRLFGTIKYSRLLSQNNNQRKLNMSYAATI